MAFFDRVKAILHVGTTEVSNAAPVPVSDAGGALTVDGTVAVTNTGTFAVQAALGAETTKVLGVVRTADGAGNLLGSTSNALDVNVKSFTVSGGTSLADDADFTAATTLGTPVMGVYEVSPTTVTGGDLGIVGITEDRELKVVLGVDGLPALSSATDSIEAVLSAIDNAVLDSIATNTATVAGAVSATHMQVDVLTMPAGGSGLTDTELRATAVPVSVATIPSHAVTNAGTFAVQATLDAETTKVIGTVNLGATDNAVLDTIAAKDYATQTTLAALNAKLVTGTDIGDVTINNSTGASAVNIQDGDNSITVDGTFWQATQPVSLASVPSHAVTNAGTFAVQAAATLAAETTKVIGTVNVASGQTIAVTNAGTFAVQMNGYAADDSATPGNPVTVAGLSVATDGTDPTSVSAEGDVARVRATMDRRLLVCDFSPRLGTAYQEESSAQTNHEVIAAPGAGLSLYITDIVVSNGATAGSIKFVEATGGTPVIKVPTLFLAINGGTVMNFKTPIRITANTNFGFTSTTMTTHSVMVNYFTAP